MINEVSLSSISESDQVVELGGCLEDQIDGFLIIPPNLTSTMNATLIASYQSEGVETFSGSHLNSIILSLILIDDQGIMITLLDEMLYICLPELNPEANSANRNCLSYFDRKRSRWKCEDSCLFYEFRASNSSQEPTVYWCGRTGHVGELALMRMNFEDSCYSYYSSGEYKDDYTLDWLAMGMIASAILLVALSVLAIEALYRWKAYKLDLEFERLELNPDN